MYLQNNTKRYQIKDIFFTFTINKIYNKIDLNKEIRDYEFI